MITAKVIKATIVTNLEPSAIPSGEYRGKWHGYGATIVINGITYELSLDNGIRGWSDCIVKVTPFSVTVETI